MMLGHLGDPHEIHAIHCIAWDKLWAVNSAAVCKEIEAIWQWQVIDKQSGEVNRHGDGQRGCDFATSADACLYAFSFPYTQSHEPIWRVYFPTDPMRSPAGLTARTSSPPTPDFSVKAYQVLVSQGFGNLLNRVARLRPATWIWLG